MSVAAHRGPARSLPRRTLRFMLTLLVFLLIGPLIGGVLMIAGLGITIGVETGDYGGVAATIATMMIYGLWTSWFMGALPALIVGALIATLDAFGRGNWMTATGIGWIAGIAMAVSAGGLRNPAIGLCYFAACLAGTLLCYAATRGIARR